MRLTQAEYNAYLRRGQGGGIVRMLTGRRWEDEFATQLDAAGVQYLREFRFMPERRFRFDFVILPPMDSAAPWIAFEIDGVVHRIKGRFNADREKGNLATLRGWRVLHVSPAQVRTGEALALVRLALAGAHDKVQTAALDEREREE